MGLLNEVTNPDRLMERAEDYAHRILANGPLAVRKTKESVLRGLATDMREAYRIESELSGEVFSSEDAREGPKAFKEKAAAQLDRPVARPPHPRRRFADPRVGLAILPAWDYWTIGWRSSPVPDRGIGREVALCLASEGAKVVVNDIGVGPRRSERLGRARGPGRRGG